MVIAVTVWGGLGSLLDSALGGWFQASVIDGRTGKVVEGIGGKKVSRFDSIVDDNLTKSRCSCRAHGSQRTREVTSQVAESRVVSDSLTIMRSMYSWLS